MGCSCGKSRQKYEAYLVKPDGTEQVLYTSPSKTAADQVAARYKDAKVRPKPAPVPRPARASS